MEQFYFILALRVAMMKLEGRKEDNRLLLLLLILILILLLFVRLASVNAMPITVSRPHQLKPPSIGIPGEGMVIEDHKAWNHHAWPSMVLGS